MAARFIKIVKAAAHSDFMLVQSRTNSVVRHPSVLMLGLICYNSTVLAKSTNDSEGDVHFFVSKVCPLQCDIISSWESRGKRDLPLDPD